ncbi:Myb-like protein U, partial [Frankliniella fusca]
VALSVAERISELEKQQQQQQQASAVATPAAPGAGAGAGPAAAARPALSNGGAAAAAAPRSTDPTLKAIQKKALLSFYERHQNSGAHTGSGSAWRSEPQLAPRLSAALGVALGPLGPLGPAAASQSAQQQAPEPPPRPSAAAVGALNAALSSSRRASSASDYSTATWRELLGGNGRENPTSKDAVVPRHQHSSSCGSLSTDLLGPLIVGPSISVDDWVPERPPKKPHLRAAFAASAAPAPAAPTTPAPAPPIPALPTSLSAPALHHHRPLWPSHCPSPDLPPPSPPPASECEVILSDEPLPPPPPELRPAPGTTPAPPLPTSSPSSSTSPPPPSQVPKALPLPSPPAVSPRVSPEAVEAAPAPGAGPATSNSTPGHDRQPVTAHWRHHKAYLETSFEGSPPMQRVNGQVATPSPAAAPAPAPTAHQQLQLCERAAPQRQSLCVRKPRPASFMRSESVKESATEAPPRYVANGSAANGASRPGNERYPLRAARAAKKLAVNGESNGSNGWLQPAVAQLRRAPASVDVLPTACNSPTTTGTSTASPQQAANGNRSVSAVALIVFEYGRAKGLNSH